MFVTFLVPGSTINIVDNYYTPGGNVTNGFDIQTPSAVHQPSALASDYTRADGTVFTGAKVPDTATWIKPGVEYNVGPYWRVFKTQMNFTVDGKNVQIPIESMISWRGQWYVVHLGKIR